MTTSNELSKKRVIVVGASRGLGAGVAAALGEAGALVTGLARTRNPQQATEKVTITTQRK